MPLEKWAIIHDSSDNIAVRGQRQRDDGLLVPAMVGNEGAAVYHPEDGIGSNVRGSAASHRGSGP